MSFLAHSNAQFPSISISNRTQADGDIEVNANSNCDKFLFTVIPASGATGNIDFSIKPHSDAGFEPIIDPATNAQQRISLTGDNKTFILLDYYANAFRVEPISVSGQYSVVIQQGTV